MYKVNKPTVYRCLGVTADTSALYASAVFHRGDVLRKWRETKRLTAQELADRAGVDKNVVSRAEANKGLREESLRAILRSLGKTVTDLESATERYSSRAQISATDREVLAVLAKPAQAELRAWLLTMRDPAEVLAGESAPVHREEGGEKPRKRDRAQPGAGGKQR
jgi:transcriptional regulator with XRE-family HTH domain